MTTRTLALQFPSLPEIEEWPREIACVSCGRRTRWVDVVRHVAVCSGLCWLEATETFPVRSTRATP